MINISHGINKKTVAKQNRSLLRHAILSDHSFSSYPNRT